MPVMELRAEIAISAPPSAAWSVLGRGFGEICRWAAPITASWLEGDVGPGAVRVCQIARFGPVPGGVIKERLLTFDVEAMSFEYETVSGLPRFFESAVNRWSIHPLDGDRCLVRTHASVRLRGPMALLSPLLKRSFMHSATRVFDELRHHIERGEPHPRKVRSNVANSILAPC